MKQNRFEIYEMTEGVWVGRPYFGYDSMIPLCFISLSDKRIEIASSSKGGA